MLWNWWYSKKGEEVEEKLLCNFGGVVWVSGKIG